MARAPDERCGKAKELYLKGMKLIEIANQLNLPEGTVRRWKSTQKWDSERSDKNSERSKKKKRGGQPGNKNAVNAGAPLKNDNAVKHGLFEKYLPQETLDIVHNMSLNPMDILWDQIQIAYAAIIRAQQINYVKDIMDSTTTRIKYKDGNVCGERWEVQQAWDKQSNFMKVQARAQSELRSMIKQYDEMLQHNWDSASEEQKLRIELMRVNVQKATGHSNDTELTKLDQMLSEIKKQAGDLHDIQS